MKLVDLLSVNMFGQKNSFVRRVFSLENLAGDVRSTVIGSVAGSVVGAVVGVMSAYWFATASPLQFEVVLNDDGFGQPRLLFDLAEKQDRSLQLEFRPPELRSTWVCEYKLAVGESWKQMVLAYLDAYRECFDVTDRGTNRYLISPNRISTRMEQRNGSFLCKCAIGAGK